jgi:fatty acid desaturase
MEQTRQKVRVQWYRSPVNRELLSQLNQRSDFKGFLQTGGYLGLLTLTAAASCYSFAHWPWYATVAIVFFHGTCWSFMINGYHELVHDSVFRTRWLNRFFLRITSFIGMMNHHFFWASHMEHHKFTLHPPDDLEVTLPMVHSVWAYLRRAIISPERFYYTVRDVIRLSRGRLKGEWENALFPESEPESRRRLFNWARIVLFGHLAILIVSIIMHWWMLPVVITFASFYGNWLFYLCNVTQHSGLQDNVPDFRLCCRTITLSPFVRFLYWHMNYHTEHHMYAAVPCYNLGKLHKAIKDDLPYCPKGLIATWKQIAMIQKKQREEPGWHYNPELPAKKNRVDATAGENAADSGASSVPQAAN